MSPNPALENDIFYYWFLEIKVEQIELEVIPDNALDLVLSPEIPQFSALYFPVSERFKIPLDGPVVYVGVCFQVDRVANIFGLTLGEMKDLVVGSSTTMALGIESLVDTIQQQGGAKSIQQEFDQYFLSYRSGKSKNQARKKPNNEALHALDFLLEHIEPVSIQSIAANAGLSERQFRRITSDLFGFSPKKIQRIMRLQTALQALFDTDITLLSDHYYDDSHRIKELKSLTGMTPGEIRQMAEKYNKGG